MRRRGGGGTGQQCSRGGGGGGSCFLCKISSLIRSFLRTDSLCFTVSGLGEARHPGQNTYLYLTSPAGALMANSTGGQPEWKQVPQPQWEATVELEEVVGDCPSPLAGLGGMSFFPGTSNGQDGEESGNGGNGAGPNGGQGGTSASGGGGGGGGGLNLTGKVEWGKLSSGGDGGLGAGGGGVLRKSGCKWRARIFPIYIFRRPSTW